jgi:hypothetical protein
MKNKRIRVGQYSCEAKNLDGPSDEFLEKTAPLIGYIVHRFNALDNLLNEVICEWICERSDSLGLTVIYKMNYAAKVDLFKRLVSVAEDAAGKTMPSFSTLIKKLSAVGSLRNAVVHAEWEAADNDGFTPCRVLIKEHGLEHEYIQFSSDALEGILALIEETAGLFDRYEEERQLLFA